MMQRTSIDRENTAGNAGGSYTVSGPQAATTPRAAGVPRPMLLQYSRLRIFACFGIILLHMLFASNVYFEGSMSLTSTVVTKACENMLMWAVPCFLAITGALLLTPDYELTWSKLLHRYVRRMALALLIFVLIFQLCDAAMGEITAGQIIPGFFSNVIQGHSWAHMWYLYLMIGLYLMTPFYKVLTRHCSDKELMALCLLLLIFVSVLPNVSIFGLDMGFYIPTSVIYPIYLFLGYLIHTGKLSIDRLTAWVLVIGCSALLIFLTWMRYTMMAGFLSEDALYAFDDLFGYSSILVVGQTAGIFALFDSSARLAGAKKDPKFLLTVDKCTFGIYLIHMIFIRFVFKFLGFDPYTLGGPACAAVFLGLAILYFCLAGVITWLIRKVPGQSIL